MLPPFSIYHDAYLGLIFISVGVLNELRLQSLRPRDN